MANKLLLFCLSLALAAPFASAEHYTVFVGTYTDKGAQGIYAYRFDTAAGKLTPIGVAAHTDNPSFLTISKDHKYLYAVNENPDIKGPYKGGVSAYSIDPKTAKLTLINRVPSKGNAPCYLSLDHTGRMLMVANYYSGTVTAYPIQANGGIGASTFFVELKGSGPDKDRQDMAHAHETKVSPDNRFVIVPDLGSDKLWIYSIDPAVAQLHPAAKPFASVHAGFGPRHITFHPNGRWAYSLSELSGQVTGFHYDTPTGGLTEFQSISALAPDFKAHNQSAEIQIHPNGRFLYASNRGPDTISLFLIDPVTGKLTAGERMSSGGKEPRNFEIDPTGTYVLSANQISGDIVTFRIDQKTGHLTPTGDKVQLSEPVDMIFIPEQ